MRTINNKKIDLANYIEEELLLSASNASTLLIQFESNGGAPITVSGGLSDTFMDISGIDSQGNIIDEISVDGLYSFNVAGMNQVKINPNANTTSVVYVKLFD